MDAPRITVLMPVYNGERFLGEAVRSILGQTWDDFELLLIDDGSSDNSPAIMASFTDPRIRIIRHTTNKGLVASLNAGLESARGEFVARMDADDVSLPQRLARQMTFMDDHPEVGICGTHARVINTEGKPLQRLSPPCGEVLAKMTWRPSPLIHPSVIMRRSIFQLFRYDPEFVHTEDYELWLRASRTVRIENIPEILLLYRAHPASVSSSGKDIQLWNTFRAFGKHYPEVRIDYDEFLSVTVESFTLGPLKRAAKYRQVCRETGGRVIWRLFLREQGIYTRRWFKAKLRRWMRI